MEEDTVEIARSQLIFLRNQYGVIQKQLDQSHQEQRRLEGLVKRMQLMAKSQTHLLKEAITSKLDARDGVMADALHIMRVYEAVLKQSNVPLPAEALDRQGAPYSDLLQSHCEHHRDEARRILDPRANNLGEDPIHKELEALRRENDNLSQMIDSLKKDGAMPANGSLDQGAGGAGDAALRKEHMELKEDYNRLQEDLQQARKQLAGGVGGQITPSPDDSSNAKLTEELNRLERENTKLQRKLEKSEAELQEEKAKPKSAAPSLDSNPGIDAAKLSEFEAEIESLKSQLHRSEAEAAEARELLASKEGEGGKKLAKLEEQKNKLKKELEEWEPKANQMVEDVRKEMKKKMKEEVKSAKKQGEKEREELMEAMAQEIEQVETKAKTEKKKLKAEVKALKAQTKNSTQALNEFKMLVTSRKNEIQELRLTVLSELKSIPAIAAQTSNTIVGKIGGIQGEINELKQKFQKEYAERKKLFNLVQELRGNIRVFCRCRPPSRKELSSGAEDAAVCVKFPSSGEIKINASRNREKLFEFDQVFDFDSTQETVYKEVSPLVTSALDGYNICIFAYGQTGTGKTFTMTGPPDNRGVNTRALNELFGKCQERSEDFEDEITVSILEVYNEQIRDLLAEDVGSQKYEIRQGPNGNYVPDLTIVPVESLDEVLQLMELADTNRSSTCTDMNAHSSRSHLMLTVYLNSHNKVSGQRTHSKLNLIDLAGSERVDKSGVKGQALKEAQNINQSLSALGDVIASRASKNGHVPFRNSKLTYLLQDCLSGDSKTLMFVCISPVFLNSDESFCSMNFAERARSVELGRAQKNVSKTPPGSGRGNKKK